MGTEIQHAVCKVDELSEVWRERDNFSEHVVNLGVGSFPTLLGDFFAGCGRMGGVFFPARSRIHADAVRIVSTFGR